MTDVESFKPVIGELPRVLILGSIPGVESIEKGEYYANPQNQFWRILYAVFDCEIHPTYEKKLEFVRKKHIAIWDVLAKCTREGSLDVNIRDPVPNDFRGFLGPHTSIRHVFFNGSKAYGLFKKTVGLDPDGFACRFIRLPSTSPAHTMRSEDKVKEWMIIRDCLALSK